MSKEFQEGNQPSYSKKEGTSISLRRLHGNKVGMKRLLVQLKLLPNMLRADTTSSSFHSALKSMWAATKPHKKKQKNFLGLKGATALSMKQKYLNDLKHVHSYPYWPCRFTNDFFFQESNVNSWYLGNSRNMIYPQIKKWLMLKLKFNFSIFPHLLLHLYSYFFCKNEVVEVFACSR